MKIKVIAAVSLAGLFMLFVTGKSLQLYIQAQRDISRHLANQATMQDSLRRYRLADGREAVTGSVLTYELQELRQVMPAVLAEIRAMKIKPARVEIYSQAGSETEKRIITRLHDSIIYRQRDTVTVKTIQYRDLWFSVTGTLEADSCRLAIRATDTITQVIYRGRRLKPWLLFFSPRQLEQTITNANPASRIIYAKTLTIKK